MSSGIWCGEWQSAKSATLISVVVNIMLAGIIFSGANAVTRVLGEAGEFYWRLKAK